MKKGWLVNDTLSVLKTKTFWHDLLEWIPNLEDKCNGYTPYHILAEKIEQEYIFSSAPDYIIRNATFFRTMNIPCKTISLLQDCYENKEQQISVCNKSNMTVFNSQFTYSQYKQYINATTTIIPLGVDFEHFRPLHNKEELRQKNNILPESILYIGTSAVHPKGFNHIEDLIKNTNLNFCIVTKDDYTIQHPRVRLFSRVDHMQLLEIINACEMVICSSIIETQHLASIEAGACGLPIITTNVGAYYNLKSGEWGEKVENNNFFSCIQKVKKNYSNYSVREALIKMKLTKQDCKSSWQKLVEQI